MLNLFSKTAALAGLLALGLTACKKDEVRVNSEFSASPVLSASTSNAGILARANAQNTAVTYSWTPIAIKTSDDSKVASTVTYTLQLAKAGTNFATVKEISGGAVSASSLAIKTVDLNSAMLFLGLPFGQVGQLDVRLKTFVAANLPIQYSSTLQLNATPYDECVAPNADTWGLVGPAGDGWPGATPTDRMLKWDCTANAYVLRSALGVGDFKFRRNQDWAINLGALTKPIVPGATAIPLKTNGEDMSVTVAGIYTVKLTVVGSGSTTVGTLTVTP